MFKKCVIFVFLTTAYTVLLVHNFTPHQHHTEQTAHHGHDHDHDDHEDGDNENAFHLLQHISVTGVDYMPVQSVQLVVQKKGQETSFINLAQIIVKHLEKPPLIIPPSRTENFSVQQLSHYFFPLKAPPAFTA